MIKRLKDTWGIWNQHNKPDHIITIHDRNHRMFCLVDGTKEGWFTCLSWFGRFTKVVSIEIITNGNFKTANDKRCVELAITIDKPDLIWASRYTSCRGKKAKEKYWRSKYNCL